MQILFALTLFVSATLLFAVQPMFAKMVLPKLGGTPAVWNTCMVFYQATLLAGYVYAHLTIKWLGPRRQAAVHLVLFCLPWLVLPIGVAAGWTPPTSSNPIPWLLMLLTVSVGLPFLFVSASAPMLQAWFSATGHRSAKDPYFLYSASNLGSILALVGYPLVLEPYLTLGQQAWSWAAGYGLLMAMSLACAVILWRSRPAPVTLIDGAEAGTARESASQLSNSPPTWTERMRWVALALVPSSLLLGVTTYMSTDIAAAPLLWVVPLMLYLLTFVLVFARWKLLPHKWMLRLQPFLVVAVAAAFFSGGTSTSYIAVMFPLHLVTFFVTAMVCHGELAQSRPGSRWLTEFYLWMSLGGVLGGMFNALLAPVLFDNIYEYPLMIALACLLRPAPSTEKPQAGWFDFALPTALALGLGFTAYRWANGKNVLAEVLEDFVGWISGRGADELTVDGEAMAGMVLLGLGAVVVLLFQRRPVRLGLGVFALLIVSLIYSGERLRPLYAQRSFYGVMRVRKTALYDHDGEKMCDAHQLSHGSTNHGFQRLDPILRYEPCSYYHREGPIGQIIEAVGRLHPIREIGVVGLGTGTMAAYGKPGQRITFYEIDPVVEQIARNPALFTYLADCEARAEVILGDARLSLDSDDPRRFDVLVLDAFSSDAIPVHLLTREAIALYFERLAEHGVLGVHISNRHLNLEPVLANLARDANLVARVKSDGSDRVNGRFASTWVAMARRPEDLGELIDDENWGPLKEHPGDRLWTDDYSNIIDVLDWDIDLSWLIPWSVEDEE